MNEELMKSLYENPESFWTLPEMDKEIALCEMELAYSRLLKTVETQFDILRQVVLAFAGYSQMMNTIVNKHKRK